MNDMSEPLIVFEPREIRIAGHTHCLWADDPWSSCGEIEDGVRFCFQDADGHYQGGWVMSFDDLKQLVADVEAWHAQRNRSVGKLP